MKRTLKSFIAVLIIAAMIFNLGNLAGTSVNADMTTVDKLMQNERLINVQDLSYKYKDIATHWAKDGMYKLSYMEILYGFVDGTMRPDKTISREEFIAMLARAINLANNESEVNYYVDITKGHWSYEYVQAAKAAGIIDIFNASKLDPTKIITREEMAVIAAKVVKDIPPTLPIKSFKDLHTSYRYMDSIRIVTSLGIIYGVPDGSFKPYIGASRAEAAAIIQRIMDVKDASVEGESLVIQAFAEDYEKSSITNSNSGTLSKEGLLLSSMGKENKQAIIRNNIIESFNQQNINLQRSIEAMNIKMDTVSKYLAEATVSYTASFVTPEGISREYNINRKLYLKKQNEKWLVYNTTATYSRISEIPNAQKINLAWQYLSQSTPDMSNTAKIQGLNVISPTWFTLNNEDGSIKSIADVRYSNWAINNGYQVWALVTNDFDPEMTSKMLNNPVARQKSINTLIQYAKDYKLHGINIDYENMYTKDRDMFTLFMKELYQKTKPLGIVLSVDVTVIVKYSNWSECYDRKALALVSDYVALMAYDQYWAGSPVSGSVSQLKWVEDHLNKVLLEVPKEKLLLGMPFYTRVWKETLDANNRLVVTSSAVSMEYAEKLIVDNNATKTWDAVSGQYYATYKKDGATIKIWLEDQNSIKLRVELANKYNLAGVASWKLGFEKQGIWDVIAAALNKNVASN